MGQTYPLPLTAAMLTLANANAGKPRYTAAGAADWNGGDVGNDIDTAKATQSIANSHSANVENEYLPRTQAGKAAGMVPPLEVLEDLGKDYGAFSGDYGRMGWTEPFMPYGPEPEPEE